MRHSNLGFTLVELLIVIAIIATILAIAIPGFSESRRLANESSVMGQMKSFSTAMISYYMDQYDPCYPKDTNGFGKYFSYISQKSGYNYYYASNSTSTSNASRIIFYAYPIHRTSGSKLFMVDESARIWEAKITDFRTQAKQPGIDFERDSGQRIIDPNGLVWDMKS